MFGDLFCLLAFIMCKSRRGGVGGGLEFFFFFNLVWKRATSIQGFLILADKDATVESLTGGSFFPTC